MRAHEYKEDRAEHAEHAEHGAGKKESCVFIGRCLLFNHPLIILEKTVNSIVELHAVIYQTGQVANYPFSLESLLTILRIYF